MSAPGVTRRPRGQTLVVWLGYLLVVLVVQEAVVQATGWDRLWVLVVLVPLAWAGKAATGRWLDGRSASSREAGPTHRSR